MSLRSQLLSTSVRSIDGRNFIPYQRLCDTLTAAQIEVVVNSCVRDVWRRKEVISMVMNGGQKVLSILLIIRREDLLVHFLETDNLQSNPLDSRLPLDLSTLIAILPDGLDSEISAKEFYDKQWEFVAPIFTPGLTHRTFSDMTILPFLWTKALRTWEGGFGMLEEVTLHGLHHRFSNSKLQDVS